MRKKALSKPPLPFDELLNRHSVSPNASIREAMEKINRLSGESMTLFAIGNDLKVHGSVTDGDIRRGLISGKELSDPVADVMNPDFLFAGIHENKSNKISEGRKRQVALMPVVDDGKVVDFIDLRIIHAMLPVDAVLMAGGKGERLRPLTDNIPKPLLPVAGKAIIDYNVEELESCGIKNIFVTVNYLGHLIKQHFEERKGWAKVSCIEEPKRLGTFGSLAYVDKIESEDLIVMNSDLLSSIDFEAMYLHHKESGNDFTIGAVPYSVSVPFAILKMSGQSVKGLEEKPTFNYFANGGVYIMRSNLLERIKKGEFLDAPDFILTLIEDHRKVGSFHIDGTWIDIGSPDDYRLANELVSR